MFSFINSVQNIYLNRNMDYSQFQDKPLQLIHVTEDGKYQMHPEAEQFLAKIPKPISIISVAGLYRTGKSYLLNRILLNRNSGFGVGPTINPCTKGLWCWGTPLKGNMQNGQKTNILIVDSQGIGALDQDQNHDIKIFTLSVLTSSIFIYNSVGSIDQNALQNLSLVVNLTKNIQLNSEFQDQDPDDLAKYFPTFFWVVRDFALQLINSEGQNISPKQYLQRALAPQKGFSDDIQQKNRIRRMLTSFFKERQCATLVRPLVNQQKLQHLYQCTFEDLRPQFVEQALNLRKKIFSNAKPKLFKGEVLDGSMYISMLKSYVKAINEGGVPNIENAWTYMCIQKCMRLQQQCYKFFAYQAQSCLQSNFPCPNETFQQEIQRIQNQALNMFQKQEIGEQSKTYFGQLQKRLKDKVTLLRMENQKQSISFLKSFIMKNFTSIQKKMRMNEFQNFQDFLKAINNFYFGLIQNGPDLPKKEIVYLDFLKKVVSQGAEIFLKQANQNLQSLKNLSAQKYRMLSSQNEELKHKLKTQFEKFKEKEERTMSQKNQLVLTCKLLQSCVEDLKKNHKKEFSKLQESTDKKIKILQIKYEQSTIMCDDLKQKNHSLQSTLMIERKERQKEKALLQLKLSQVKEQLRVLVAKDKQQEAQLNELNYSFSTKLRQQAFQAEKKINQLSARLKAQINKNTELSESVAFMTAKIQKMEQTYSQSTKKYQQELRMKIEKYENQRLEFETQKSVKIELLEQQNNNLKSELQELKWKYISAQKCSKETSDRIKLLTSDYQTKLAVQSQKSEFLKIEVDELKQKTLKDRNHYESLIKNMRMSQEEELQKMMSSQRQNLEEGYKEIIRNLQTQIVNKNNKLEEELRNAHKIEEKVKFEYEIELKKLRTELKTKLQIIQHLEDNNQKLLKQNEQAIVKSEEQNRAKQQAMFLKIQQLQQEIQHLMEKATFEQEENNNRSQESLKQIKNYYQLEKEKLEHKIALEKDKYQKRLLKFKQQYEGQIQEERKVYQQQIDDLREQYHNETTLLKDLVESLTHQNDSKNKTIDIYEKRINQQKQKLEKKQVEYSTRLENLIKTHSAQKEILQGKVLEVSETKNKLQKQIIVLQHQKEQLAKQTREKTIKYESKNEQIQNLNKNIEKIQNQHRQKLSETNSAYMNQKLNYEKKIALLEQQREFYSRKIADTQKDNSKNTQVWQQKLQKIKSDHLQQIRQLESRKITEYQNLEAKYQKLKKSSKQFQQQTHLKLTNLQRDIALEKEKYSTLSLRYKDLQDKKLQECDQLANELSQSKEALSRITKETNQEIQQLKKALNQIENEKTQVTLLYEKDKILNENKLNFLQKTKEKNKKEYTQKIRSLEQTLQNMQKVRLSDKNYYENIASQNLARTEKKYQAVIQENNQNHYKKEQEYEQNIKRVQLQLRSSSERFGAELEAKEETIKSLQKKVKQLQESQKRAQYELQRYKNSKELMNNDNLSILQRQKQNLKLKIHEKEEKYKKIEGVKQQLFLDIEREKAKWNLEKDNYAMKVDELKETIAKYERDNQKLQRENEKLKAERKNSKLSSINGYSKYSFQRANSKYLLEESVSSINMSVSKQSCNPLGEISFFNNH